MGEVTAFCGVSSKGPSNRNSSTIAATLPFHADICNLFVPTIGRHPASERFSSDIIDVSMGHTSERFRRYIKEIAAHATALQIECCENVRTTGGKRRQAEDYG